MTQLRRAAVPSAAPVFHHRQAVDTQESCKFPLTYVVSNKLKCAGMFKKK